MLEKVAVAHLALTIGMAGQLFEEASDAVTGARSLIVEYMEDHPEFSGVGARMLATGSGLTNTNRSDNEGTAQ